MANNSEVAHAWGNSRPAKAGNYHTDGLVLWSYRLKIGEWIDGEPVLYEYTASGEFYSATTSRHVSLARTYATKVLHPKDNTVLWPEPDKQLALVAKVVTEAIEADARDATG